MKKIFNFAMLVILVFIFSVSCSDNTNITTDITTEIESESSAAIQVTEEQTDIKEENVELSEKEMHWLYDINALKQIAEVHPFFFVRNSKEYYEGRLDDLLSRVDDMDDMQITLELKEIVASMGDYHTTIMIDKTSLVKLPVSFEYIDGKYYVVQVGREEKYYPAMGKELVHINGVNIDYIELKMGLLAGGESCSAAIPVACAANLSYIDYLKYCGVPFEERDYAVLGFVDEDGIVFEIEFQADDTGSDLTEHIGTPVFRENNDLAYWDRYFEEENVVYIKYSDCLELYKEEDAKRLFEIIENNNVTTFVLDMRNNAGGYTNSLDELYDKFLESDLKGKIYVVTNRQTMSAALFPLDWKFNNWEIIHIGEPTGASTAGLGGEIKRGVVTKSLPYSGVTYQYCAKIESDSYYSDFVYEEWNNTILPDVYICQTIQDYIGNGDAVLEWIFTHK